jgi:hypothetical protein
MGSGHSLRPSVIARRRSTTSDMYWSVGGHLLAGASSNSCRSNLQHSLKKTPFSRKA